MKFFKKILTAVTISTVFLYSNNIYANTFNDVKEDNWAYDYIENIAKLGLLVGDLSGNFNPNLFISKFDAVKILAKLEGYNPNTNNETEKQYYKTLNNKYRPNIAIYENKFSKWDTSCSYELSYLLENNILKPNELEQFIVLNDNKEQIRALSKEELALYLVRIIGLEEEVNKMYFEPKFLDHNNISKDKVNSVYYLDSLNIIKSNENFNPKNAVTKAELAFILTNFLDYTNIKVENNNYKPSNANENIYTKFITIEKTYPLDKIIQTKTGYNTNVYKLEENATITLDNKNITLDRIPEGISAEVTISNSLVSNININSNIKNNQTKTNIDNKNIITGTIKDITKDNITISYISLDNDGFLENEKIEIIPFSSDYKINRKDTFSNNNEISIGDIANITLYNNMVSEIYLENKNTIFIGQLINISDDKNYLTIKTSDDKVLNLELDKTYKFIKNNEPQYDLNSLTFGDKLTLTINNNKIVEINANSKLTEKQGIINSIKIYPNYASLTLQDENNIKTTYYINTNEINIYSSRIFDKVNLTLESRQIKNIKLIERKK